MIERLPVVEPLERALYLRSLDLFRDVSARDLALLAQLMEEEWLRHGTVLYGPGMPVHALHLIVEGRVRCARADGSSHVVDGPEAVGVLEILADAPPTTRAVAESNLLALGIDAAAFLDVLEDRFPLVLQLRAALGRRILPLRDGEAPAAPPRIADREEPEAPAAELVRRLLWLRHEPELRDMGVSVLAALLREPRERQLAAGEELWRGGDEASFFALVLEGEVGGRGAGAVLGLEDAFAALPRAAAVTAQTPAAVLAIDTSLLLDAAEDHVHVATRILAHCSRRLLRLLECSTRSQENA